MHISGGFTALDKAPLLYQSLLNTHYDIEIGKFIPLHSLHRYINFNHSELVSFAVEAIRIDLPRTFPENVFFENIRTPLFNVLVAYANHNKDIGYCQGLNYIAGENHYSAFEPFGFDFSSNDYKIHKFHPKHVSIVHRSNINCHKKWRMDILVVKNPNRRHDPKLPYENDERPHHRHWCTAWAAR